jgi:hypothetical protein
MSLIDVAIQLNFCMAQAYCMKCISSISSIKQVEDFLTNSLGTP